MADLLTHVLVGFIIATILSWRYEWITPPMVVAAMVGAASPDLNRLELVIPAHVIETTLGIPWGWWPLHTLGGLVLVTAIVALIVPPSIRWQVVTLFVIGAISHHVLDLLLLKPSGRSYAVLWPLTQYHPPMPGFYLSSDRWPAALTTLIAFGVWVIDRRRSDATSWIPVSLRDVD